jgi:thioredoxin reductase
VRSAGISMRTTDGVVRERRWMRMPSTVRGRSDFDCIIVGAPAGLSAALMISRSRRRVLVLDSGAPRHAAAHGVLGHDGLSPAALRERGLDEVARDGVSVRAAEVGEAETVAGGVCVDGSAARWTRAALWWPTRWNARRASIASTPPAIAPTGCRTWRWRSPMARGQGR